MGLHQSWYRAAVLGVECGTGPHATSTSALGSMLRTEDAEAGVNFLTPATFEVVKQRLEANPEQIERFRVPHNLLSSQPDAGVAQQLELTLKRYQPTLGLRNVRVKAMS
jgi:hypothetical protein